MGRNNVARWEKHYIPKEAVGQRSIKRKHNNQHKDYYEYCWDEVEGKRAVSQDSGISQTKKQVQRYYSEKVSFFKTVFKTIKRLVILLGLTVLLFGMTLNKPQLQTTIAGVYVLVSLGVILHSVYYIIRCLFEGNLRL